MNKKGKAISALLAVFPTLETFNTFAGYDENEDVLRSFLDYAVGNEIIPSADSTDMRSFISNHTRSADDCTPPPHLNFQMFLEQKRDLLKVNFSTRAMTQHVSLLLKKHQIDLPHITSSMLTRLKKEPIDTIYKQNVLRSIAFWIGHERADLGSGWNYESLLKLCKESKSIAQNYTDGVRIGFALYSRGEVIDHEIVEWLKKTLRDYIGKKVGHFLYGRWGKVRTHDFTTLYVDFPKEDPADVLTAYRTCIRDAVSLAHQISIKWGLSKYCTKSRFFIIGISAGKFSMLDHYNLSILDPKIPGDPVIRVTDYVRQCLLINDIRVILCEQPHTTTMLNGESSKIWWIIAFWSVLYFDFVSDLLEDDVLQDNPASETQLNRYLWLSDNKIFDRTGNTKMNAIQTFFAFPQNSLLGVEIAKTLYYRRKFTQANEVLRIVLSMNPREITARSLRMQIFGNQALDSPNYSVAMGFFDLAEEEAGYIRENCFYHSEEFYSKYCELYLAKAILILKSLRKKNIEFFKGKQNLTELKSLVFSALETARISSIKGIITSPTGVRSAYLFANTRLLMEILKHDEEIFTTPEKPIGAESELIFQTSSDTIMQLSVLQGNQSIVDKISLIENINERNNKIHDASISLQAYRVSSHFGYAVALWDMMPIRTVAIAKKVKEILTSAMQIAISLEKDNVCVFSSNENYGTIIPAGDFVQYMKKCIMIIEEYAGPNLYAREEGEVIERKGEVLPLLMTVNF